MYVFFSCKHFALHILCNFIWVYSIHKSLNHSAFKFSDVFYIFYDFFLSRKVNLSNDKQSFNFFSRESSNYFRPFSHKHSCMRCCSDNLNVVCQLFYAFAFTEDGKRVYFLNQIKNSVFYRSRSPFIFFNWPPIFVLDYNLLLDLKLAFNQEVHIVAGSLFSDQTFVLFQ